MSNKIIITVKFINATYKTKKEKQEHIKQMLLDKWEIEHESKLNIKFRKIEKENI